jgi:hypothetical protein
VSVKLTPEICINNTSSNSRLTAAGRQATATDSHSQNCLQILFSLSLPLMRKQLSYTCMLKNLLKLYCNWTWDIWWAFLFVCFLFLWGFVLRYVSPLMRQLQNNIWGPISRIADWGMNTKIIKTEISLHLNLEVFLFVCFILFYFLYIYFFLSFTYFFIFILTFTLFIFYFQSSLCLSNAFSAYGWLVHCLFETSFVCFFVFFFYLIICFSLFL